MGNNVHTTVHLSVDGDPYFFFFFFLNKFSGVINRLGTRELKFMNNLVNVCFSVNAPNYQKQWGYCLEWEGKS